MQQTILTQAELDLIASKLISCDHKRLFAIARYTGQNITAICNLKVFDLYNKHGVLMTHVKFSGVVSGVHFFPIHEPLKNQLLMYSPENFIHNNWLFPSSLYKGKSIKFTTVDKWLRTASKKAGLEHLNVSPKMIRDAFIVELYRSGMSNAHIKQILGVVTIPEIAKRISKEPINFCQALQTIFG